MAGAATLLGVELGPKIRVQVASHCFSARLPSGVRWLEWWGSVQAIRSVTPSPRSLYRDWGWPGIWLMRSFSPSPENCCAQWGDEPNCVPPKRYAEALTPRVSYSGMRLLQG